MSGSYTVAYWTANKTTLDAGSNFTINDTAANIQAALSTLTTDTHISAITVSDSGVNQVVITVAQITSAASALAILKTSGGATAPVIVSDTAAHISASFATIATDAQVNKIVVSNSGSAALQLTASQIGQNTAAVAKLYQSDGVTAETVTAKDTAANLVTYLAQLQAANANIASILVSNNTQLTLTATQVATDAAALAKVAFNNGTTTNLFKVVDSAANVGSNFDALAANSKITTVTLNDASAPTLTLSASTVESDHALFAKISATAGHYTLAVTGAVITDVTTIEGYGIAATLSIAVSDSAANVQTDLALGAGSVLKSHNADVSGIVLNDGSPPSISEAASVVVSDASVFAKISASAGSYTLGVTGATVAQVATIEAQSFTGAILSIAVTDTAADVQTDLALGAGSVLKSHFTDITGGILLTDGSAPTITETASVVVSDASLFAAITATANAYTLDVTAATVAQVNTIEGQTFHSATLSFAVSDSAAAVQADLTSGSVLTTYAGSISAIVLNDASAPTLTLSAATVEADHSLLANVSASAGSYTLAVTDASISDLTAIEGYRIPATLAIAVTDTASGVQSDLSGAGVLAAHVGDISSITLSNLSAPTISEEASVVVSDASVFAKISAAAGSYTLDVTDASVAQVNSIEHQSFTGATLSFAVSDTAADVQADLTSGTVLTTYATQITAIVLTDGTPPTITLSASAAETNAGYLTLRNLSAAAGSYTLDITDASISDVTIIGRRTFNNATLSFAVTDTATDVQADLASGGVLAAHASSIGSIVLTDATPPTLTLSASTVETDSALVSTITASAGSYTLDVTGATISDVTTIEGYGLRATLSFAVSDSAANLQADLSGAEVLKANIAHISGILLNGHSYQPITETAAVVESNVSVLAKVTTYGDAGFLINVTDAALTDVTAILRDGSLFDGGATGLRFAVSDTAANIQAGFAGGGVLATVPGIFFTSIVINDVAAPTLTLSASTVETYSSLLANITASAGSYTLDVTGAAISDITTVEAQSFTGATLSFAVSDTAAHVQADLTSGHSVLVAQLSKISAIALSPAGDTITLSAATVEADASVFAKITTGAYTLDVTGAAISDVATIEGQSFQNATLSIAVTDTAANISGAIGALAGDTDVSKIVINDGGTVTITAAQAAADTAALGELYQSNGTTPATVTVSDTASAISGAFSALNGNTHVTAIVINDGGTVTITAAEAGLDGTALSELYLSNGTTHATVTVSDTATDISGAFDALNSNSHVSKIVVASGTVTITAAQAAADTAALGELYQSNGTTPATVTVSGTASDITGALDALNLNTYVSKIVVSDSASNEVVVSVGQLTSDATALSKLYNSNGSTHATVTVSDTATNIGGTEFDTLNGNTQVNTIIVTSGSVTITAAQAGSDGTALGELYQSNGTTPAHVTVSDSAANISGAFDALSANTHVGAIVINDGGTVTIAAAQVSLDDQALNELYLSDGTTHATVTVSDTAAGISEAFNALNLFSSYIGKIVISDAGTVTLTAEQAGNDSAALIRLYQSDGTTRATVTVSDTAGAISSALDALSGNGNVSKIVVSDSDSNTVTITAAQAGSDGVALGELYQSNGTTRATVTVSDTASDITGALDALNGNTHVSTIIVSDSSANEVVVSVGQLTSDAHALGELYQSDGSTAATVTVSDAASAIGGAEFDALNGNGQVNKIIVASGTVAVTAAQAAADTTALSELYQSDGATPAHVTVSDTASNIASAFNALSGNAYVNKIVISSGTVTITAAQAAADTVALGELYRSDGVSHATVTVSDTASAISGAFSALNANTHVGKIIISDAGTVTITALQAVNDSTALGELRQSDGSTPATVTVSDTAADISSVFNALNNNAHVSKIIVSDSASYEVVVSVSQLLSDSTALSHLYQSGGITAATVTVSDTASAIYGALDELNSDTQADKIIVTDSASNTMTFTASQVANDGRVLGELYASDGITLANINVSDSAGDVQTYLNSLEAVVSRITAISLTDVSTPTITVNEGTFVSDLAVLEKIGNTFNVAVTGVSLAQLATVEGDFGSITNLGTGTVGVSDSGSNIQAALDTLNTDSAVTSITISNNAHLALSAEGAVNDAHAISLLHNANSTPVVLTVSDSAENIATYLDQLNSETNISSIVISDSQPLMLTAAQIQDSSAIGKLSNADHTGVTIDVTDTAANISLYLDALQANDADLSTITISDDAAITVTVDQLGNDITAIGLLVNADSSPVTLIVEDTAANILANSASLAQNSEITAVEISDNAALTLQVSQYQADTALFAKLANADGSAYVIDISDSSANISAGLDHLNGSHIARITVAGSDAVTVSVGQITTDATALSKLYNATDTTTSTYTLDVVDGAAHIAGAVSALNGNAHVVSVSVVDSSANVAADLDTLNGVHNLSISLLGDSPDLSVSETTFVGGLAALAAITNGSFEIDVTGVAAAQVAAVESEFNALGNAHHGTLTIAVSDAGGAFTEDLLASLGDDLKVASITVTSGVLSLTVADMANTAVQDTLEKISGSFTVDVSAALVGDVSTVEGEFDGLANYSNGTLSIAVADTGADLTDTYLSTFGADANVTSISVTSGAIALSVADMADTTVRAGLDKITGAFTVDVASAAYSDVAAVETDFGLLTNHSHGTLSIAVSDTATNLTSAHLVSLGADADVTSIAVSSGAISLTEAQFVATGDLTGLAKITGAYTVDVTGVSAAQVAAVENAFSLLHNSGTLSIAVSDAGGDFTDTLLSSFGANSHVTSIAVTSGGIALSVTDMGSGSVLAGLDKITGAFTLDVTGALVGDVGTVEEDFSLLSNRGSGTLSIAVADAGGSFTDGYLTTFGDDANVTSITVTSGAIDLSVGDMADSTVRAGLDKISGAFTVDVAGAAYGDVATVETNFGLLTNHLNGTLSIAVSDTATNLTSAHLVTLGGDADVTSIAVSSGTLSLTEAQFTAAGDLAGLAKITGNYSVDVTGASVAQVAAVETALASLGNHANATLSIEVTDTASAISTGLDALNTETNVASITISPTGDLTLTAGQVANDTAALGKISGSYSIDVIDMGVNISANLGALNSNNHVSTITISDNAAITVDVATLTADGTALGNLINENGQAPSLIVTDTAANISDNLTDLAGQITSALAHSPNPVITEIVVTGGGAVNIVSIAELTADAPALAALAAGTPAYTLAVSDDAGNITGSALSTLETLAAAGHLASLTVSDSGDISVTVAQITSDADVLAVTTNHGGGAYTLAVSDTSANIAPDLDALGSNSHVTSITLGSDAITLTAAEFTGAGGAHALGEITNGSFTITVTGVAIADVAAIETTSLPAGATLASIVVTDSAANLQSDLSGAGVLKTYISHISSIVLTGSATQSITETAAVVESSASVLDKVVPPNGWGFIVDVTHAAITDVTAILALGSNFDGGATGLRFAVSDTAAHVQADLTSGGVLAGASWGITSIVLDDVSAPTLTLSASTVENDSGLLALVTASAGSYTLDVTGAAITDVTTIEGYGLAATLSFAVTDTAAHVQADLSGAGVLEAHIGDISAITLNDAPASITETADVVISDAAVFAKITTGAYTLDVTGASVAQTALIEAQSFTNATLSIAVSDTATSLTSAALATLGGEANVTSITVTSGTISLTEAQFLAAGDLAGIAKISGFITIDVTGVAAADVAAVQTAYNNLVNSGDITRSIAVSDVGSAFTYSLLAGFGSDPYVTSITVTSGAIALSVTEMANGTLQTGLEKITGAFTVDVSAALVGDVSTVEGEFSRLTNVGNGTLSIAVSDDGGNLTDTYLSSFGGDTSVTSITVTSDPIALTVADMAASTVRAGLDKISGAFTVDVAGALVSDVSSVETEFGLLTNHASGTLSIAVSDISAAVAAALDPLGSDADVTSITLDSSVMSITEAEFVGTGGAAALAKIQNTDLVITVTGVTVAERSSVEGVTLPGSATLAIHISDTSAHVAAALDALGNDSNVTSITLDSSAITVTAAELVGSGGAHALNEITNPSLAITVTGVTVADVAAIETTHLPAGATLASIVVNDTAAHVQADLANGSTLNTYLSGISAIVLTDVSPPTITLVAAEVEADAAVFTKLSANAGSYTLDVTAASVADVAAIELQTFAANTSLSFAVRDGAADVQADLNLGAGSVIENNLASIASIVLSDGSAPTLALSEAAFVSDASLYAKITAVAGSYTLAVTGVTVAQVATVEGVSLPGDATLSVAVADTGAHLTNGVLNTLGADAKVASIAVTGSAIGLTESQFVGSTELAGLAKIAGAYTVDVTGATAAQVSAIDTAFSHLGGSGTLSISVADTGANLTDAALNSLGADAHVSSIAATGAITLTEGQFVGSTELAGLAKIGGGYTVDVTGVTAAQVSTVEAAFASLGNQASGTLSIAVSDTAANLDIGTLGHLGADADVTSITVSDGLAITIDTQSHNSGVSQTEVGEGLAKVSGAFTLLLTNVQVGDVAGNEAFVTGLPNSANVTLQMAVSDSGSAFNDAALTSLGADTAVVSLAVNDGQPIVLSASQFTSSGDLAGLAKITSTYTVDVTGSVIQVPAIEIAFARLGNNASGTLSIAVADSSSQLSSSVLNSLGADAAVSSIAVNGGAIAFTETQFTSSGVLAGLAKVINNFAVSVTGVSAAQVQTVETDFSGLSNHNAASLRIFVSDTGADLTSSVLASLAGDAKVASIAVTSGAITLTEGQLASPSDVGGLNKITGSYALSVTGASVSQVAAAEGIYSSLVNHSGSLSIAVSDTGNNLTSAALATLGSDSRVASIAVTSGVISLTESQFTADSAGLAKLTGAYALNVTGVAAADVSTVVEAASLPGSPTLTIAVSDTGANLTDAALNSVGADSHVSTITVTTGAITLTEGQLTAAGDLAGLAKITGPFTVDVTGATAAQVATVESAFNGLGNYPNGTLSIAVADTGANLTDAALNSLGSDGQVTSISVTGPISLTEAQVTAPGDLAGLAKITGPFTVDVSGATVSQVSTVKTDFNALQNHLNGTLSIAVSDAATNLTPTCLLDFGRNSAVTSITITSGTLTLTETQAVAAGYLAGLAKISGAYAVNVTGATVAQVSAVETAFTGLGNHANATLSIAVSDLGTNLTDSALNALGADTQVASIAATYGAISLTGAQIASAGDLLGLAKITTPFTVNVTGATVAQVTAAETAFAGLANHANGTLSITVSDVGANLTAAALASLAGDSHVTSIAVTSGAISVTEAQFITAGEVGGLDKITGGYTLDVTGVTLAQMPVVEAVFSVLSSHGTLAMTVSTTAAQVQSDLTGAGLLAANIASIGSIVMSDASAPTLTLSAAAVESNAAVLADLSAQAGSYTVSVTGAAAADVSTIEAQSFAANTHLSFGVVSDTGVDFSGSVLGSLGSDANVGSIAVTSGPITVTESQFVTAGDLAGLGKITGAFTVDVTGVTAAQVSTVKGDFNALADAANGVLSIAVSDTGADFTPTILVAFGKNTAVTSIAVTSGSISMKNTQFQTATDQAGLAKIVSGDVNVTGVVDPNFASFVAHYTNGVIVSEVEYTAGNSVYADLAITHNVSAFGLTGLTETAYTNVAGAAYTEQDNYALGSTLQATVTTGPSGVTTTGSVSGLSLTAAGGTESFIIGGGTSNDTFHFGSGFGNASVTGYTPGSETFDISSSLFANFADMMAHAQTVGGDVVITYDAQDYITLHGVTISQLNSHSGDFHFI